MLGERAGVGDGLLAAVQAEVGEDLRVTVRLELVQVLGVGVEVGVVVAALATSRSFNEPANSPMHKQAKRSEEACFP